jgi:hypothetical protein
VHPAFVVEAIDLGALCTVIHNYNTIPRVKLFFMFFIERDPFI